MADQQIVRSAVTAVPFNYTVPGSAELRLKAVYAEFDDNGAASDWLPTVTILSDSGHEIARACEQEVLVSAGSDADVSWFPHKRRRSSAAVATRCTLLGSANGTDTLTIPLTAAVPGTGTLHVVFNTVSVGHNDEQGDPDNVTDSQAVAGWVWSTATDPLIGLSREDFLGGPPAASVQAGSVARPCAAADLGIGDSITVHFNALYPADFHSCGLVIYQRAYFVTVKQFGFRTYGNSADHPDGGASLTRLSWDDDYGPGTVTADKDAVMITAMGAWPAVAGFTPFVGTKIGEIASGTCSVAAVCKEVCQDDLLDPGGTWPAGATGLVGNYQMVEPRICSN